MRSSAHCEQQIIVPNTSILYCSEKCRRKDQAKPPPIQLSPSSFSFSNWITPPLTPFAHDMHDGPPPKNYVEPFSPTPPRSVPGEGGNAEHSTTRPITIAGTACPESHYFSPRSGQISPVDSLASSPTNSSNIYCPPRRPMHLRSLTGSSLASISSTAAQTTAPSQYQLHQQRPLPPLHNPVSCSSSPRSIELVTPSYMLERNCVSEGASPPDMAYPKKPTLPTAEFSSQVGSLKTLFNFDAIRGRPTHPHSVSNPKSGVNSPIDRTPDRSPVRQYAVLGRNSRAGGWL